MKTQYYTATSLDGFIATEDDSLEWLFPLGDLNKTKGADPFVVSCYAVGRYEKVCQRLMQIAW